jgi:hypothetical protein
VNWSDLFDQPERCRAELAKAGVKPIDLVLDLHDVDDPYVQAKIQAANGDAFKLLRIALEWFGDEGHPQPTNRRTWTPEDVRAVLWRSEEALIVLGLG